MYDDLKRYYQWSDGHERSLKETKIVERRLLKIPSNNIASVLYEKDITQKEKERKWNSFRKLLVIVVAFFRELNGITQGE